MTLSLLECIIDIDYGVHCDDKKCLFNLIVLEC